nr:hypothetical protein OH837_12745 [Streptomyces canus]
MATPQHRLISQLGAHVSWSQTDDRAARTAPAREAFNARFEAQVDPDGILPPKERAIRAAHARKAYYLALAMKSAAVRAARKAGGGS